MIWNFFKADIYTGSWQARVFVAIKPLHATLMFASKTRAYPSEAPSMCLTLGQSPDLTANIRPAWDKCLSDSFESNMEFFLNNFHLVPML